MESEPRSVQSPCRRGAGGGGAGSESGGAAGGALGREGRCREKQDPARLCPRVSTSPYGRGVQAAGGLVLRPVSFCFT